MTEESTPTAADGGAVRPAACAVPAGSAAPSRAEGRAGADLAGHSLLVLGSMDEFVGLCDLARSRGCRVVVADGYPDGPARAHADENHVVDVRDIDALARLARETGVDGAVASFSDVLFESLCRLTHRAGLYSYCPLPGMERLRDKRLMARMLDDLGAPMPRRAVVRRGREEQDCAGLHFPCVMKPVNGYGSYGVFVVGDALEVRRRFDLTAAAGGDANAVLVEEYDDGPEINMIGWVADGTAHAISLADREKCPLVAGGVPNVVRITYPSRHAGAAAQGATRILQGVADACGIQDGPLSMQFFWHPQTGTLSVCEVAGRVLGYEHENVEYGSGLSVEELLLDLTYDRPRCRELVRAHALSDFTGVSFVLNFHALPGADGVVADDSAARAALSRPEALPASTMHYRAGERVGHGKGAKPYVARVFCHTETYDQADRLTAELFRSFSVKDERGRELVCRQSLPFMEEWGR